MSSWWTRALVLAAPADAALALALPAALAGAVDAALGGQSGAGPASSPHAGPAVTAAVLLALVLLGGSATGAVLALAGPVCSANATFELRRRLFQHLLDLGPQQVDRPSGDLTARLVGATSDAGGRLPAALGTATALLTSLGAVLGLALLSPWLALAFFGGVLPGILLVRLFSLHAAQAFVRYQSAQSDLAARLTGALAGLRSIQAAGAEQREQARILRPLPELSAAGHALWTVQRRTVWQATVLIAVVELAVLATAGTLVAEHALPPGALAAAAGWAALGVGFFEQVEAVAGLAHARAGRQRVAELLDTVPRSRMPAPDTVPRPRTLADPPPGPGTAPHPRVFADLPPGNGELTLRAVLVRDAEGRTLLGPLDLTVASGSTVALVGATGSGKSLLAALAGRLRDPDEGEVLIDGVPVAALRPEQLRAAVGYAFERPVLVGRTLGEALEGAGPEQFRAARAAGFLGRLPHGVRTPVEELRLSGGEWQRLGLARLLAQRPRLVVLDDATSSLDLVTEYQVTAALEEATRGRTRLLVAHRARAAARADLVAWLDAGRLRALAPHGELLADPEYRAVLTGLTTTEV